MRAGPQVPAQIVGGDLQLCALLPERQHHDGKGIRRRREGLVAHPGAASKSTQSAGLQTARKMLKRHCFAPVLMTTFSGP